MSEHEGASPVASTSTLPRAASQPKRKGPKARAAVAPLLAEEDAFFMTAMPSLPKPRAKPKAGKSKRKLEKTPESSSSDVPRPPKRKPAAYTIPLSDDEDSTRTSEIEELLKPDKPARLRKRSLTPPDAIPVDRLVNAQTALKAAVQAQPTFVYTAVEVDSTSGDEGDAVLDPELAAIAQTVATTGPTMPERDVSADVAGDLVQLKINMIASPAIQRNELNEKGLYFYEKDIDLTLGLHESFERIFSAVAGQKGLGARSLVLTYNDRRIYPTTTPASLNVYSSASFKGYKDIDYEVVLEQRRARDAGEIFDAAALHRTSTDDEVEVEVSSSPVKDNVVEITVRGKGVDAMSLSLRDTTKISQVIRHFLKEHDLLGRLDRSYIEYDGEKVAPDSMLRDLEDFEDGCCLDCHVG